MFRLTKQEQIVLCLVALMLLSGFAVKAYRTANKRVRTVPTVVLQP